MKKFLLKLKAVLRQKTVSIRNNLRKNKNAMFVNRIENSIPKYGLNRVEREKKIIVSLTSYPARFDTIYGTFKSLLLQTMKPDAIYLWLDCEKKDVPAEMLEYEKYGIEIKFVNSNLKPHTKYYYAMKENPDAIVITVDDDIIYPENTIESLVKSYERYPNSISARRVHRMRFKKNYEAYPYSLWDYECEYIKKPSHKLVATGVGGVLYPPNILGSDALDISLLTDLALFNDDLWLKWIELKNDVKVVWVKNDCILPPIASNSQKTSLCSNNVNDKRNDGIEKKLETYFLNVVDEKILKELL